MQEMSTFIPLRNAKAADALGPPAQNMKNATRTHLTINGFNKNPDFRTHYSPRQSHLKTRQTHFTHPRTQLDYAIQPRLEIPSPEPKNKKSATNPPNSHKTKAHPRKTNPPKYRRTHQQPRNPPSNPPLKTYFSTRPTTSCAYPVKNPV